MNASRMDGCEFVVAVSGRGGGAVCVMGATVKARGGAGRFPLVRGCLKAMAGVWLGDDRCDCGFSAGWALVFLAITLVGDRWGVGEDAIGTRLSGALGGAIEGGKGVERGAKVSLGGRIGVGRGIGAGIAGEGATITGEGRLGSGDSLLVDESLFESSSGSIRGRLGAGVLNGRLVTGATPALRGLRPHK